MWTIYKVHVRPLDLRDPDRFPPGTRLRVVDPATGKPLPPEGAEVRVIGREVERYWDRNERAGDVEITMAVEHTPWAMAFAKAFQRAELAAKLRDGRTANDEVTP